MTAHGRVSGFICVWVLHSASVVPGQKLFHPHLWPDLPQTPWPNKLRQPPPFSSAFPFKTPMRMKKKNLRRITYQSSAQRSFVIFRLSLSIYISPHNTLHPSVVALFPRSLSHCITFHSSIINSFFSSIIRLLVMTRGDLTLERESGDRESENVRHECAWC